jgi:phosphate-selective porin OprO and OprP
MRNFLQLICVLFTVVLTAQEQQIETKTSEKKSSISSYYTNDKKLGFTAKDSLFQVNIGFRVQSRATYLKGESEDPIIEGEVRRMRLKLDGFIYNPKFGYKVELGFAALDMASLGVDNSGNVLLDGVFYYKPTKKFTAAFGQTKLPGNNQRVISSGSLEFTDRTINNSRFNIDRDFGFFVDYSSQNANKFSYNLVGALTTGEGRNWTKTHDDGVSLTGKVELFPLGAFTKNGSHFEADLEREKAPKLMVSGAFNQNNNAMRTQGQLGSSLFEARTMQSLFVDSMLKYNGWAAEVSYMNRNADDPITVNPIDPTQTKFVFVGQGIDAQLSYLFPSNYQIAARYSTQSVAKSIELISPDVDQIGLCFSKYILSHKFKIQTEFSHQNLKYYDGTDKKSWYGRLQIVIGI